MSCVKVHNECDTFVVRLNYRNRTVYQVTKSVSLESAVKRLSIRPVKLNSSMIVVSGLFQNQQRFEGLGIDSRRFIWQLQTLRI